MSVSQEVISALAKAARVSDLAVWAALAIEETPEFRRSHLPVLNGELHPDAVAFALAALKGAGIET